MLEARKYRSENLVAEHIFSAPTEAFRPWFTVLALQLEDSINERARSLSADDTVTLQVGSELELNIFANTFDADRHHVHDKEGNPNYTFAHRKKMDEIASTLCTPTSQGGLNEILYEYYPYGSDDVARRITKDHVFLELRSKPCSVSRYIEQMENLAEWWKKEAVELDVKPVVHSQHIHISLQGDRKNLLLETSRERRFVVKGLIDIYHRALPLVRMPEEIEFPGQEYHAYNATKNTPVKPDALSYRPSNEKRIEARINNSEYAFDPYLNLVVHLLGVARGLKYSRRILGYKTIDKDFPLDFSKNPAFFLGDTTFEQRVQHLLEDNVVNTYLPREILEALASVIMDYKKVSEGKMSVADLKRIANAKAFELDPDMYVFGKGK